MYIFIEGTNSSALHIPELNCVLVNRPTASTVDYDENTEMRAMSPSSWNIYETGCAVHQPVESKLIVKVSWDILPSYTGSH